MNYYEMLPKKLKLLGKTQPKLAKLIIERSLKVRWTSFNAFNEDTFNELMNEDSNKYSEDEFATVTWVGLFTPQGILAVGRVPGDTRRLPPAALEAIVDALASAGDVSEDRSNTSEIVLDVPVTGTYFEGVLNKVTVEGHLEIRIPIETFDEGTSGSEMDDTIIDLIQEAFYDNYWDLTILSTDSVDSIEVDSDSEIGDTPDVDVDMDYIEVFQENL